MTRADLNTSYTKLKKVIKHLNERILESHKVKPKDSNNYRSDTYKVWNLIYDQQSRPVQYFYQCSNCTIVAKFKLSNGNWKMRRHPCFQAWKAKNDAKKKLLKKGEGGSDSEDESDSDGGSDSGEDESDDNDSNGVESDDKGHSKGDESGLTSNEKQELGSMIETFSNLCHKYGPIRAYDAIQLAPENWTANDWYVTTFFVFIF